MRIVLDIPSEQANCNFAVAGAQAERITNGKKTEVCVFVARVAVTAGFDLVFIDRTPLISA